MWNNRLSYRYQLREAGNYQLLVSAEKKSISCILIVYDLSNHCLTTFSLCFTNRVWLSKTKLKNVKYKIVIFKPELLKGKISKDPQTLEAAKPVRWQNMRINIHASVHLCLSLANFVLIVCFPVDFCQILSTCVHARGRESHLFGWWCHCTR